MLKQVQTLAPVANPSEYREKITYRENFDNYQDIVKFGFL